MNGSVASDSGGGAGVPQNGQKSPGVSTSRLHFVHTKTMTQRLPPGERTWSIAPWPGRAAQNARTVANPCDPEHRALTANVHTKS